MMLQRKTVMQQSTSNTIPPGALRADRVWHVDYPEPICVVEGSTTTIPCNFTHPELRTQSSGVGRVVRVVWCPNHLICQGETYSVYDSAKVTAGSRFEYLGDRTSSCTLQISKTTSRDAATYRFRIETNVDKGSFAGPLGVTITVKKPEDVDVAVRSSISGNVMKEGGQVTLTCTADCSFHQLDVKWYRDGQALSETGPALHLSSLTIHNTGNYTCSLDTSSSKTSLPWSLVVEADGRESLCVRCVPNLIS
ncbi:hypothetical protein N1851_001415 [Merluccius polli]|uniref:Ig-like domain-containing protein n=1 Tax=Merluccius polli TaxID=89951 RepID=A0AA47NCT5_MERPO|nr:hypothetical protein N1851_001415 [Merluccius polli]